jgi:hypothetical protein
VSLATGPSNTRDKLRSSNMLGFVCFIPLFDGIVFQLPVRHCPG